MTAEIMVTKWLKRNMLILFVFYKKDIIEESGSLHGPIAILNRYQKP